MNDERAERRRRSAWYAALTAGLAPVVVVGWVASAVADRLSFAAWALVAGAAYTVALHRAFATEERVGSVPLAVLALAWGLFAALLAFHREAWDLGFRAFLPALYHPWLASPAASWVLAALLAAGAAHRLRRIHP